MTYDFIDSLSKVHVSVRSKTQHSHDGGARFPPEMPPYTHWPSTAARGKASIFSALFEQRYLDQHISMTVLLRNRSFTSLFVMLRLILVSLLVFGGVVDGATKKKKSSSDDKPRTSRTSSSGSKKKILSFGGNGMIGSETLSQLIEADENEYDIVLVSRGSWPFDSEERIRSHVRNIICDRKAGIEHCHDLLDEIRSTDEYYAVLDFSAYHPHWVKDAVEALDGKARVYVYVSTDSVYEVTGMRKYRETGRRSVETDAVRPSDDRVRERLNEKDRYGDKKFGGEEVLMKQRGTGSDRDKGIPFVSLRFADVIGPRDNTDRFLTYYTWIKFHHLESVPPIAVPKHVVEGTSVTYVKDAAQSIIAAIDESNRGAWNEAYNIACEEVFNVTSQIMTIGHLMGKHHLRPWKVADYPLNVYPSVTIGPVDVTKAKEELDFSPTPLDVALLETVAWYEKMFQEDKDFRKDVLNELIDILDETNDYDSDEERRTAIGELMAEIKARGQVEYDEDMEESSDDEEEEESSDDEEDEDEEEEDEEDWDEEETAATQPEDEL